MRILHVSDDLVSVYCHRPRKDCNGRDIRHVRVRLAQCQQACNIDCRCKSIQAHGTTCWLKHYACKDNELRNIGHANDYVRKGKELTTYFLLRNSRVGNHYVRKCKERNTPTFVNVPFTEFARNLIMAVPGEKNIFRKSIRGGNGTFR